MSVNIQVLDYKFQEEESPKPNGMLTNYSFTSSSDWTLGNGWTIAGGQATLSGKIFRIGHMGKTTESDIKDAIDALKIVLPEIGFKN